MLKRKLHNFTYLLFHALIAPNLAPKYLRNLNDELFDLRGLEFLQQLLKFLPCERLPPRTESFSENLLNLSNCKSIKPEIYLFEIFDIDLLL